MTRRILLLMAAAVAGGSQFIATASAADYTLAVPGAPVIRNTTSAAKNEWLASNSVASVSGSFLASSAVSSADVPGKARFMLAASEAAFSVERIKPEVWLGDALPAPDNVDWNATYEYWAGNASERSQFIFDNNNFAVYTQVGGTLTFRWFFQDGTHQDNTYVGATSVNGRPFKLFWTDEAWAGPAIDLSGKFVKLYGDANLLTVTYGKRIESTGGRQITNENVVVRGVYYDQSAGALYAYGGPDHDLKGQFILAYYDSGAFDKLKHIQVVEVGQPDVVDMTGHIGEAIKPYGTGYNPDGLVPSPVTATSSAQEDELGPYYYQHKGSYSYSPKNNDIFPLRDTTDTPWRIDVYWMEEDAYGVRWPFERCQYACSWPTNSMPVMLAGDHVKIPDGYTAELVKYQVPNGHARAPSGGLFTTTDEGYSTLKLTTADNVWFVPINSVSRTNTNYFTLAESSWTVGTELRPRGGSVAGTADAFTREIDPDAPGYLDLEHSSSVYNPDLYYDWTSVSNDYESVIYAVNAFSNDVLEVHWYESVRQTDMPEKLSFPCLPQRYKVGFPEADMAPQIVLASQQGGAATSVFHGGQAFYFDSAATTAALPATTCFASNAVAVTFMASAEGATEPYADARVLTLASTEKNLTLAINATWSAEDGASYTLEVAKDGNSALRLAATGLAADAWNRVTFTIDGTNACAFANGALVASNTVAEIDFGAVMDANTLGANNSLSSPAGLILDNLVIGTDIVTEEEELAHLNVEPDPDDLAVSMCFTFPDGDLEATGTSVRYFTEDVSGRTCAATDALRVRPGAPRTGNGIFEADSTPIVYRQPDAALPGYNPNEEHAFIGTAAGGYYAWALRCDLNTDATSEPGVLVQYVRDGRPEMKYFPVLVTNDLYTALAGDATVGTLLPGPHPLDTFDNPWLAETYWDDVEEQDVSPAFPDRKNQVWSRCAGTLPIHMYYPNQDGFDFPGETAPAIGEPVAWLGKLNGGKPVAWTWTIGWPENIENMRIGETLTKAANGLPEVWNAKSMAVVYPDDGGATALLWDPTRVRTTGLSGYANPGAMMTAFGFDPAEGNVTLRGGKYRFQNLPPSVSGRFYVNANLATENCVCIEGELESNAGGDILFPNVLNSDEIESIKALVADDHALKTTWNQMIETLPTSPIEPSTLDVANGKAYVDYAVRDHYALTAMGATNYVVTIENDSTNSAMRVADGDAISMHVFRVKDEYYPGRVVTREDPVNLLSQQLSILYTESLAGKADGYEFEWRNAKPALDGSMPTDYTNIYSVVKDANGLTRFTIGQQGDTLANLVNTYYVMRYRATPGSPAYAVMGDKWSDWCGPALAEGWIQRCVNNVTPFTQRMQDLYENAAETTASMIAQAGKPWTGDVALNQDNLTEVGLIELYQTLLNKAESMSLTLGLNDTDANKQLLLAAERLADLYVLLGNEAYADALDPSISFGTEWPQVGNGMTAVDFGTEATGLFCFDNQVSSLLDEELALLRGRTGANNPSVTAAPFYNRLVWNYTRGITAGEVAYAVNYNINSANGDAKVDEDDAAKMYPQGHGDAYGHYLTAMSVWYRLLRNPYFSWSTSQMQMNVADSVVDVDYFDEERFAEAAGKLATTAEAVMDRTARKAWRDNGGVKGAGYLDDDTGRNFGYGEWATRGGIGGLMNWMVANSILPEAESAGAYYALRLEDWSSATMFGAPVASENAPWTFEFQTVPDSGIEGRLFRIEGENYDTGDGDDYEYASIVANLDGEGKCDILAGIYHTEVTVTTNTITHTVTNIIWEIVYDEINDDWWSLPFQPLQTWYHTVEVTNIYDVAEITGIDREYEERFITNYYGTVEFPAQALVALAQDADGAVTMRVIDTTGAELSDTSLGKFKFVEPHLNLGGRGFCGTVGEMRIWQGERSSAELHASRTYVNPRETSLVAYSRALVDSENADELADETPGGEYSWFLLDPIWTTIEESGLDVAFEDAGLLRINRATAGDLNTIVSSVSSIQTKLDKLDSGMNPLGLSDAAVPFDIAPEGVSDKSDTHFEQIADRAERALSNAAKMLGRAQQQTIHLRQVQESQTAEETDDSEMERDYKEQLIAIYGTPYEDDIGAAGTYAQGYDGPDLYHFMYMDLEQFGVTGADNLNPVAVVTYDSEKGAWSYESMEDFMKNSSGSSYSSSKQYSYQLSANGLVVKPSSFTGKRKACGKIQDAYTEYILAYVAWQQAYERYSSKFSRLSYIMDVINKQLGLDEDVYDAADATYDGKVGITSTKVALQFLKMNAAAAAELADASEEYSSKMADKSYMGAGLAVLVNPLIPVYGSIGGLGVAAKGAFGAIKEALDGFINELDAGMDIIEAKEALANAKASWNEAQASAFSSAKEAISDLKDVARELQSTWATMVAAAENFDTIIAEGDRIQEARELDRSKSANRIIKLRYNDMFFRQVRDEALTRYNAAFDLAQRYVYMAAQTYDFETCSLSRDKTSGDAFRAEVIGSRSLGAFDEDGSPLPAASSHGDPGLADILYRMKENYGVLKGRLGINNTDGNTTWFSLRKELFRIASGSSGDKAWRKELSKYLVSDVRSVPEYRRFCQSFASSETSTAAEPALVIPFSSTIDYGKNFFGKDVKAGDHALDSSYYATKIAAAGVKFAGYPTEALSATPVVYLVPTGADRMRIPGGGEGATVLDWNVVDQVIPVPYSVGASGDIDADDWQPLYDGYTGGVDVGAKIRRIPSFRAATDDDAECANTRLVGRSAWNSKWVLIIPAGQLLGGDAEKRAEALDIFINGLDTDRDGVLDTSGVSDIVLGLKTYSMSGN